MKIRNLFFACILLIGISSCQEDPWRFTATINEEYSFNADYSRAEKDATHYKLFGSQGKSTIEFKFPNPIELENSSFHYWAFMPEWESGFKYTPNADYPARHYKGSTGSIRWDNVSDDWISGSFIFWCVNSLNPNDSITIVGMYDQIPF